MKPIYLDIETDFKVLNQVDYNNDVIISCQTKFLEEKNTALYIASLWQKQKLITPKTHFKSIIEYVKNNYDSCIVGSNLKFEFGFYKAQIDSTFDPRQIKSIDIKDTLILMNNLVFSRWHERLGKSNFSKRIPELYNTKQFALIENYIQKEVADFEIIWKDLRKYLPIYFKGEIYSETII